MKLMGNALLETAAPMLSPFGILSPAAFVVDNADEHWGSGFIYETTDGAANVTNLPIYGQPSSTAGDKVVSQLAPSSPNLSPVVSRYYFPFDIQASIKSSTFGTSPEEIESRARQALALVTQKAVEREFWTGNIAKTLAHPEAASGNRYLASAKSVDITPTPGTGIKPRHGQALLERALGSSTLGSQGVIHTTRDVASAIKVKGDSDSVLRTNLDTPVIAGVGYSITGPNGTAAAAGTAWMYATGPVTVTLGAISIIPENAGQAVNVSNNLVTYYVDRPAAVTWSTSESFAVLVDLSLDYA